MSNILQSLRPLAKTVPVPLPPVQALKMMMAALKLNMATLARRIRVHRDTVKRWLSGKSPISVESLSNDDEIGMTFGRCLTVVMAERVGKRRRVA